MEYCSDSSLIADSRRSRGTATGRDDPSTDIGEIGTVKSEGLTGPERAIGLCSAQEPSLTVPICPPSSGRS